MTTVEDRAVAMVRHLRGLGVAAPPAATVTYAEALAEVGVHRRAGVYWAGRATLVRRPEDVPAYERAFAAVWDGAEGELGPEEPVRIQRVRLALDDADGLDGGDGGGDDTDPDRHDRGASDPVVSLRWSDVEVLARKDFAACTAAELDEAHRLMADLRVAGATRASRRRRPSRRQRGDVDVRRTARLALRTGGEPIRTARLARGERPRPVVLLCDVSGSMEPYARALVRFAHAAVVGRREVEAFALGTRCTRITRDLGSRDPDVALAAAAGAVADWSGGTRLGAGLRVFNDRWGVRGTARGATVVILSDGWDRGDPEALAEQMGRLGRVAHRVVWVNPLKASPGYQPLARGMAAALPYVDDFVEGHSLRSLEELAAVLRTADGRSRRSGHPVLAAPIRALAQPSASRTGAASAVGSEARPPPGAAP